MESVRIEEVKCHCNWTDFHEIHTRSATFCKELLYRIHEYQLDPVHNPTSHFLKIHLNIILPSTPESPKWSLSLRFPHEYPVYASPLLHTHYMPHPTHSSRFCHPHNIGSYHIILLSTVIWKKVALSYITISVYEYCENKITTISFFPGAVHTNFYSEPHLGVAAIFTLKYGAGLLLLRFQHGRRCRKTK